MAGELNYDWTTLLFFLADHGRKEITILFRKTRIEYIFFPNGGSPSMDISMEPSPSLLTFIGNEVGSMCDDIPNPDNPIVAVAMDISVRTGEWNLYCTEAGITKTIKNGKLEL